MFCSKQVLKGSLALFVHEWSKAFVNCLVIFSLLAALSGAGHQGASENPSHISSATLKILFQTPDQQIFAASSEACVIVSTEYWLYMLTFSHISAPCIYYWYQWKLVILGYVGSYMRWVSRPASLPGFLQCSWECFLRSLPKNLSGGLCCQIPSFIVALLSRI